MFTQQNRSHNVGTIQRFMRELLAQYRRLRGQPVLGRPFWDVVVVSASDYDQQQLYQAQIEKKLATGELPLGVSYRAIADPAVDTPVGSGGSTLHILSELERDRGESLYSLRILMIHAGGRSKRLPSCSCRGKLFCPIPVQGELYDLLDLKLALFVPFAILMQGGVFVTASDDIEVFDLEGMYELKGQPFPGITALAHPSSLEVGKGHGVFVLPPNALANISGKVCRSDCLRVMQKPSLEEMVSYGAVLASGDQVYTDSAFWIDVNIARRLVAFYQDIQPLTEETCIYGDYLQCLGLSPAAPSDLPCLKVQIRQLMSGTPLNLIVLGESKFYHLGSMIEFIDTVQVGSSFYYEMSSTQITSCTFHPAVSETDATVMHIDGICMRSLLHPGIVLPRNSVVESSILHGPVVIGPESIVSQCVIDSSVTSLPPGLLYHSVPILTGGNVVYVTIAFGVSDDLKAEATLETVHSLQFCNRPFGSYLRCGSTPNSDKVFTLGKFTLWDARLFPVANTMSESFLLTLNMIKAITDETAWSYDGLYLSMSDIIQMKSVTEMLRFNDHLHEVLQGNR